MRAPLDVAREGYPATGLHAATSDAIAEALRIESSIGEDGSEGRQEVSRDDG